jgi:hypothetical protein
MWKSLLALALLLPSPAWAQDAAKPDVWKPFRPLLGSWEGSSEGKPGKSAVQSKFEFLFNGKFMKVSGKSVYPPQDKNPKGQRYEGFDMISYDHIRQKFVLRQFSGEGFVNQYALDQIAPDGKTIVFVTESMENLPPGFHARKTYRILNENEFTDTFELAPPGRELETYVETRLKRRK